MKDLVTSNTELLFDVVKQGEPKENSKRGERKCSLMTTF